MKVWRQITEFLQNSGSCALVTVAHAAGSTPRDAGARMVVDPFSRFSGTIGGGTLELEAIRLAANAAGTGVPGFFERTVSLGPDLGQCCGGRAKLAIEVLTNESLEMAGILAGREAEETPFGTSARVLSGKIQQREITETAPSQDFLLSGDSSNGGQVLLERFGSDRRTLYVFGAGHIGKALILALAPLPFEVTWIDARQEQFPGAVPSNVKKVCAADPVSLLDTAPDRAFILAVTHSHPLDEEIMARALLSQRFGYCGVIGSKTKRNRFLKRLRSRGLNDTLIKHMVCPVGVPAIKSKHPAAIAAGIAVDLLERNETLHQQAAAGEGLAQNVSHGQ